MKGRRLARSGGDGRRAAPISLAHLGLGNFFRAHQAFYTEHAPDAAAWGYAAFAGRSAGLAEALAGQNGLYTLVVRGPEHDELEVISSLSQAHPAADHDSWLAVVASSRLAAITVTVTEAGYLAGPDGRLDTTLPAVASDLERLGRDHCAPVVTAPARLVAGLAARRRAGAGPIALVPCDNVGANGTLAGRVVADLAERVDPGLAVWIAESVSVVSTVVDRITPRATSDDTAMVARLTARLDQAVVVTEPFCEWVLSGTFPAGRPRWEQAGALFVDDVTPYEQRKLWLLNGAHSLLAYSGSIRGHATVAEAVADETCRAWVEQWWAEAGPHLDQPPGSLRTYETALLSRFSNSRMQDQLARIAEDGSQKLAIRVLPVVRAERAANRLPVAAARILAAWICHLHGLGGTVRDVRATELVAAAAGTAVGATRSVLSALDPAIGADAELVSGVADACRDLAGPSWR